MTTLVLAGHGSHLDANSSTPVRQVGTELRRRNLFSEVRLAFWKEEPSFARCLDGCDDPDVVVAPVFISNGYFTRTVIPREMHLDGPLTVRDGRRIRYTRPVGSAPALADVLIERAREAGATADDAVVILGHGTRRDPESATNVLRMAERVRASGQFAEAGAVFLDQEPDMRDMLTMFAARTVVVVPFFIAEGWHVGQTIPADLALEGSETRRDGRVVRYARAAGTHPGIADVVLSLVGEE